jgi:hypothetical protein
VRLCDAAEPLDTICLDRSLLACPAQLWRALTLLSAGRFATAPHDAPATAASPDAKTKWLQGRSFWSAGAYLASRIELLILTDLQAKLTRTTVPAPPPPPRRVPAGWWCDLPARDRMRLLITWVTEIHTEIHTELTQRRRDLTRGNRTTAELMGRLAASDALSTVPEVAVLARLLEALVGAPHLDWSQGGAGLSARRHGPLDSHGHVHRQLGRCGRSALAGGFTASIFREGACGDAAGALRLVRAGLCGAQDGARPSVSRAVGETARGPAQDGAIPAQDGAAHGCWAAGANPTRMQARGDLELEVDLESDHAQIRSRGSAAKRAHHGACLHARARRAVITLCGACQYLRSISQVTHGHETSWIHLDLERFCSQRFVN